MAPRGGTRDSDARDEDPAPIPPEPLCDEIFAACGYAFTIAAVAASLLTPRLGTVALIFGAVFAALLVPVNVLAIRRCARVRRSLRTRRTAWRAAQRVATRLGRPIDRRR